MLGYHLLVLLNHGLNKFELSRLKAVVLNQLYGKQSEFRTYVSLDHMNMNMNLNPNRIKSSAYLSFSHAKRGNNLITCND